MNDGSNALPIQKRQSFWREVFFAPINDDACQAKLRLPVDRQAVALLAIFVNGSIENHAKQPKAKRSNKQQQQEEQPTANTALRRKILNTT